jgi:hypothetical protein
MSLDMRGLGHNSGPPFIRLRTLRTGVYQRDYPCLIKIYSTPRFPIKTLIRKLMILRIIAPTRADQKSVITKPSTSLEAIMSIKALTTKVNNPRVSILRGRVKRRIMGLRRAFRIPRTKEAIKRVPRPWISIPLTSQLVRPKAMALMNQRIKNPLIEI